MQTPNSNFAGLNWWDKLATFWIAAFQFSILIDVFNLYTKATRVRDIGVYRLPLLSGVSSLRIRAFLVKVFRAVDSRK